MNDRPGRDQEHNHTIASMSTTARHAAVNEALYKATAVSQRIAYIMSFPEIVLLHEARDMNRQLACLLTRTGVNIHSLSHIMPVIHMPY